jgi:hypothetical protein
MFTAPQAPLGALMLWAALGPIAQATAPSPHPAPTASPLQAVAPTLPCPTPRAFAAIAIDPVAPISVNTTQQFVVALRAVEDAGYAWRLLDAPKPNPNPVVRFEGMQSIGDASFQNLGAAPGAPPIVGGAATELFLFLAGAPGSAVLTFGEFAPGTAAASKSVSFTVQVSPLVVIC